MRAKLLSEYLTFALKNNRPVLIKSKPGMGKSDIVEQAVLSLQYDLMIVHPVVEDPTDPKGIPWVQNGVADFVPFANLRRMMEATQPLVVFIDDLGQAAPAVQAAYMQLLLARQINGKKISEHVRFVAATNRREDKSGVSGILEAVKSRFSGGILELDWNTEDWCSWAYKNNMPSELISFIQYRSDIITDAKLSRDIVNSASPRTVAGVGVIQNAKVPQHLFFEVIQGIAGEIVAIEYDAFLKLYINLPTIGEIESNPDNAKMPYDIGSRYALIGMIADKMSPKNIKPLMQYLRRMQQDELMMACMQNSFTKNPSIASTMDFIQWASVNAKDIL